MLKKLENAPICMANLKVVEDFKAVRDHCIVIRRNFNTYAHLELRENLALLSKIAPVFFTEVGEILQRDWVLQVCKLMDPPTTRRKGETLENLTVQLIVSELEAEGLCNTEIKKIADRILNYGAKLDVARNKNLAHLDHAHYFLGNPLGQTSHDDLIQFMDDIQVFCDAVATSLGEGPLDFSASACAGDVIDFVSFLRGSVNATQSFVQP